MMKRIYFFILVLFLAGCEKTINFEPNSSTPSVVVEGIIESGQPPIVILSKSVDYFSQITPEILAASFVRNADVFISNGSAHA